jgi:hypothetical protein
MAELARNYHNDLQPDDSKADMTLKDEYIKRVLEDAGTVPAVDVSPLERSIQEEDIVKSLKASARRKAPGMDGMPTEFWMALRTFPGREKGRSPRTDRRAAASA